MVLLLSMMTMVFMVFDDCVGFVALVVSARDIVGLRRDVDPSSDPIDRSGLGDGRLGRSMMSW